MGAEITIMAATNQGMQDCQQPAEARRARKDPSLDSPEETPQIYEKT